MTEYEKKFIKICEQLKTYLIPYKTNLKKIRIGDDADGGYVLSELDNYDALYSYGSNDQTSFEREFYNKYKKESYVYDHTIDGITDKPDYIHFFKEGVAPVTRPNMDTIDNHIIRNGHTECKNLMGQIDIEGHEWFLFKDFKYINNFSQLIIEFHINAELTQYEQFIHDTFQKLNENFVCTHIHGTNCPLQPWLDGNFPRVFEATYVRKDLIESKEVEPGIFPIEGLDYPGDPKRVDLRLDYWHNLKDTSYCDVDDSTKSDS